MKRPLSKTKQLRRQLREAQKQAQLEKQKITHWANDKQREVERLKTRLQSIGAVEVAQIDSEYRLFTACLRIDGQHFSRLKNPGNYLADIAGTLIEKLVEVIPGLRGPVPETFLQNLRTLPADRRRARLAPLFDSLRETAWRDHDRAAVHINGRGTGPRHCGETAEAEIHETLNRTMGFHAFCQFLDMLEKHAHLIRP